jgi:hypothetical protein
MSHLTNRALQDFAWLGRWIGLIARGGISVKFNQRNDVVVFLQAQLVCKYHSSSLSGHRRQTAKHVPQEHTTILINFHSITVHIQVFQNNCICARKVFSELLHSALGLVLLLLYLHFTLALREIFSIEFFDNGIVQTSLKF